VSIISKIQENLILMHYCEPYHKKVRLYYFCIPNKETRQLGEFYIFINNNDSNTTVISARILRKAPQNGTIFKKKPFSKLIVLHGKVGIHHSSPDEKVCSIIGGSLVGPRDNYSHCHFRIVAWCISN
jgi:hypothetical protein